MSLLTLCSHSFIHSFIIGFILHLFEETTQRCSRLQYGRKRTVFRWEAILYRRGHHRTSAALHDSGEGKPDREQPPTYERRRERLLRVHDTGIGVDFGGLLGHVPPLIEKCSCIYHFL